jgi:hypothetical protein
MRTASKKRVFRAGSLLAAAGLMLYSAGFARATAWAIELIDGSGLGKFSSMKIDRDGNVHVAYIVEDGQLTLKYGFWDHKLKRWFTMPVAKAASFCALTLDSKQRPHISWADDGTVSGTKLRYAYWDGSDWKKQAIQLNSDVIGYYTGIALDPQDRPSISFYEYRGPRGSNISVRMRVVSWTGERWQVSTADGENQSGKFNALAADSQGRIHLAYGNVGGLTAGMRYGLLDGKSWKIEILEGLRENRGEYVGQAASITVDKAGDAHVSYMNATTGVVKYAERKNGKWQIQVVDRVSRVAYPDRNGITLDEEERPFISYYDFGAGSVKIAYRDGNRWMGETIDSGGCGFTSSIQVHEGAVWVSYADDVNHGLKVAHGEIKIAGSEAQPASREAAQPKASVQGKLQ